MKEGGKEERVYRVVQAARGAIPETGALNRSRVIHKSSGYLNDLSTREPATKRKGFSPPFVRLSHTQAEASLAALTVYDIHVT